MAPLGLEAMSTYRSENSKKNNYTDNNNHDSSPYSPARTHSLSPIRTTNTVFYDSTQSQAQDFYPTFVKSTKSRAVDPSMNQLIEPIFTIPRTLISGKRMTRVEATDFSRIGYGSNCTFYDTKPVKNKKDKKNISSGVVSVGELSALSDISRTDTSDSPIRGQGQGQGLGQGVGQGQGQGPGQGQGLGPVQSSGSNSNRNNVGADSISQSPSRSINTSISREYIGCDDKIRREEKRRARYNRTFANMEGTKRRLEEAVLDKRMKELLNQKSRNEDNIRYDTTVFANDVKCFRSQPLQVNKQKTKIIKMFIEI